MASLLRVNYLTTCKIKRIWGERCEVQILFRSVDVTEGVTLCFPDLALPGAVHSAITLYLLSGPSQRVRTNYIKLQLPDLNDWYIAKQLESQNFLRSKGVQTSNFNYFR